MRDMILRTVKGLITPGCLLIALTLLGCAETDTGVAEAERAWQIGPFEKYEGNPILTPQGATWEAKDVFNPAAWTDGETVYMLYRAEDTTGVGRWNGTSRIGLATSRDGLRFELVLAADFELVLAADQFVVSRPTPATDRKS